MDLTRIFPMTTDLRLPRERVLAFFADSRNLQRLTPPWLKFHLRTPEPLSAGEGAVQREVLMAIHEVSTGIIPIPSGITFATGEWVECAL